MSTNRPIVTRAIRVLSALLVAFAVTGPAATAIAASIQTDLFVYQRGDTVTVMGDGFGPVEGVDVATMDPNGTVVDLGTTDSDDLGNFTYQFVLDADVPGIYDVVATGRTSGLVASTQFDPPALQVTPSALTFAQTGVGLISAQASFTLKNNGQPANNITISLGGTNPSDFLLDLSGTAQDLAAGAQTTFKVAFSPTGFGTRTATLTAAANNGGVNGTSSLTGTTPAARTTSTGVSCLPSSVAVGSPATCAVTVSDTSAGTKTAPTGAVSWSASPSGGSFDATICTLGGSGNSTSCQVHYTPTTPSGSRTISATYTAHGDHAGSAGNGSLTVVAGDTTPPVITNVVAGTAGLNGWYVSDVTVTWTVSDPESAVVIDTGCGIQSVTVETPGTTSSCTAHSAGGSSTGSVTVKVDKTPPLISVSFTPGKNVDGWNNTSVVASYACADHLSGIDPGYHTPPSIAGCPGDDVATAEGLTTFDNRTTRDRAGNVASVSPSVDIDAHGPTIAQGTVDGTLGSNGWYTTDVVVHYTAADSLSGLRDDGDASFTLAASGEGTGVSTGTRDVQDKADNVSTAGPLSFDIDKGSPVITCASADGDWHGTNVSIPCSASDAVSGLASAGDASFFLLTSVDADAFDGNASTGTHQVCDVAGNCATAGPIAGNKVDLTSPVVSCEPEPAGWQADNVAIACSASDTGSGISGPATTLLATSVPDGAEDPAAVTGSHAFIDVAGNVATAGPIAGLMIDRKAPQLTGCTAPDGVWHASEVTLMCSYTDGGSGPATQDVALSTSVGAGLESADAAASANGDRACDATGNCAASPADIDGNQVDRKGPSVSCAAADGAWHAEDVGRLCIASDGGSGVEGSDAATLVTGVTSGEETDDATTDAHLFFDAVGNVTQAGPLGGNRIDKKKPGVTCGDADTAWHGANITLTCTASDGGSGLADPADAAFNLSTTVPAGSEVANAATGSRVVIDAVGNSELAGPISGNKVDRKSPVVSCDAADGLWHAGDVSIACTAADGGSGLANPADASFSLSTSVPIGTETANASTAGRAVADAVGNAADAGPISGNKVDKKGPSLSITTPAANGSYVLGQAVPAGYGCADAGSGPVSCSGTVPNGSNIATASVGLKTFTVSAADAVGNTSTLSVGYTVAFSTGTCNGEAGHQVLQPINADGSSVFKRGSTVPVKFRVCDARGTSVSTNVFDPGHAAAPVYVGVSSGAGAIDEQTFSTTPDDAFRWDPTAKQWIFNLSTKNLLVGKTYTYWIYLADGSHVEFTFGTR